MSKKRLDILLFEKGMAESRERAKAIIMSGIVFVDGQRVDKPGSAVSEYSTIDVRGSTLEYVSRGGLKLEKALSYFGVSPEGKLCIDCGASTGGFTDCLLKGGAEHVYSVDVGYGQIAWSLRNDPRVTVMERTNIRHMNPEQIPQKLHLAVIDVSFISLKLVLPVVRELLTGDGEVVCLIKPQFEAGREKVGKKGVVRDLKTHIEVLEDFCGYSTDAGFSVSGITYSPITGPQGNIEFLGHLTLHPDSAEKIDVSAVVSGAHAELVI